MCLTLMCVGFDISLQQHHMYIQKETHSVGCGVSDSSVLEILMKRH